MVCKNKQYEVTYVCVAKIVFGKTFSSFPSQSFSESGWMLLVITGRLMDTQLFCSIDGLFLTWLHSA